MKDHKILSCLALSGIIALQLGIFPTTYTYAAGETITLNPNEGEVGNSIKVNVAGFKATEEVRIYFSGDNASVGDEIDSEVTAYKYLGITLTDASGNLETPYHFTIPSTLADGTNKEEVRGGDYYVYITYFLTERIEAVAKFTIISGVIELNPEKAFVGNEVEIIGEYLRAEQKIKIKFDSDYIDISSGDTQTDIEGKFTCVIIIPETPAGYHKITAIDEAGNKPEAEFRVRAQMTISPTSQIEGKEVMFSGVGFGEGERITITYNGIEITTIPGFLRANRKGSFNGSFIVPFLPFPSSNNTATMGASDESYNVVTAELTVLTTPTDIILDPVTSSTSPGYVGMTLSVRGTGFAADTKVTVTYGIDETTTIATTTTDNSGNFKASFTVPPGTAGSYTITSTDGTNSATSIFIMESEAPPLPVPQLPKFASTVVPKARFDWDDVHDPSGVSYILQIALDNAFTDILLEKKELSASEYTLTEDEKLGTAGEEVSYYWRVRALDDASNESEWTLPTLFYSGSSGTPTWNIYVWIGVGVVLIAALAFWMIRIIRSR